MVDEEHGNRIAGRWERSRGAGRAAQRAAVEPHRDLGSWPLSGPEDAQAALDGLDRGDLADLAEDGPDALGALLEDARYRLEHDRAGRELLGLRLALAPEELGEVPPPPRVAGRPIRARGVAVVAPDWSELLAEPFRRVARALAEGSPVVLVGDARVPMAAEAVARALVEAGVPDGALALLQGLSTEGLAALVGDPRVGSVEASGDLERMRLVRRIGAEGGRAGDPVPRPRLELLRARALELDPEEEPERAAERVWEAALGRARTLSGQRHGQVARVFCPERLLSRFTEALLATLARAPRPVPMVDRAAAEAVRRACRTGQDEGATWIAGNVEARAGELELAPTVFTNVEPHMALLRRQAPMPVLSLVRIRASRRAAELPRAAGEGAGLGFRVPIG